MEDSTNKNGITDAEIFAKTILEVDQFSPLYRQMYQLFNAEMRKAVEGCICTPERMAKLYPLFREINIETDEIERSFAQNERKYREQAERRKAKKAAKGGAQ